MDSIWEGFGTVWDVSWALFGRLLVVSWLFKSNFLEALVQDGPQEASWIDLGSILEGFGKGFGKGLGKVWGKVQARLKRFKINVSSMQGGGRCFRDAVYNNFLILKLC